VGKRLSRKAWEQLARMVMRYGGMAVATALLEMDPNKMDLSAYAPKPRERPGPKPNPREKALREVGWFVREERARDDLISRGLPDSVQEASRLAAAWLEAEAEAAAAGDIKNEGIVEPSHSTGRKAHRKVRNALGFDAKPEAYRKLFTTGPGDPEEE
jgi:hypothetical protein